jgi:hypothetical protein
MADSYSGSVRQCLRQDSARSARSVGVAKPARHRPCSPGLEAAMACGSSVPSSRPATRGVSCHVRGGYRRDHYVSVPVDGRRPDTRPRGPTAADTSMASESILSARAGHLPSGRRWFRKQRTVNPPLGHCPSTAARSDSLQLPPLFLKAGLRAAACGGRPRPATTRRAPGAPASPRTEQRAL